MTTETGGPAFPHVHLPVPGFDPTEVRQKVTGGGMTLRDYFAAKAMQAMLSSPEFLVVVTADQAVGETAVARVSNVAYRYADGMLEARK